METKFKAVQAWDKVRLCKDDGLYYEMSLVEAMKLVNELRQAIMAAKAYLWDEEHGQRDTDTALHEALRGESE
jgi:hypothetical protein